MATSYEDREMCMCAWTRQGRLFCSPVNSSLLLEINIPIRSFLVFIKIKNVAGGEKKLGKWFSILSLVKGQPPPHPP